MRIREYKSIFEASDVVMPHKRYAGEDIISVSDYPSGTKFPVVYLNKKLPDVQLEAHKQNDTIKLILLKRKDKEFVFSSNSWEKVLKATRTTRPGWRPVKK